MGNKIDFESASIPGVFIGKIKPHIDHRGKFYRLFDLNDIKSIVSKPIVEVNFSENKEKGTVRGMHYENIPDKNYKIIKCIKGSLSDYLIDIRKGSKTFLKKIVFKLFEDDNKLILVPNKVAHGFQTLEANTSLLYMHTIMYNKNFEFGLNVLDPKLGIEWELPIKNLSERDLNFKNVKKTFNGI